MTAERATNILTIDVEDWFHILDVDGAPGRTGWGDLESRVGPNTERLLELLEDHGAQATFFVVGWVAARHPELVRRIANAGHELGSHSFWHELLRHHNRRSLSADLERSKKHLEDLSGEPVRGFRAPGSSITQQTLWALDVIIEHGFEYDSSICPGYASHGGFPSPHSGPHRLRCASGELVEIPASTIGVGRRRISYAGGGYLRLLPYTAIRAAIAHDNRAGRPANVYVHPREIDPEQPRMQLPALRRFKYYVGLGATERKLRVLLRDHCFVSCGEWIAANQASLAGPELDLRGSILPPDPDPSRVPPMPPQESVAAADLPS